MNLPKTLLGAMLVGLAVQTTGCKKGETPEPKEKQVAKPGDKVVQPPANCPACGLG